MSNRKFCIILNEERIQFQKILCKRKCNNQAFISNYSLFSYADISWPWTMKNTTVGSKLEINSHSILTTPCDALVSFLFYCTSLWLIVLREIQLSPFLSKRSGCTFCLKDGWRVSWWVNVGQIEPTGDLSLRSVSDVAETCWEPTDIKGNFSQLPSKLIDNANLVGKTHCEFLLPSLAARLCF